MDDVQDSFMQKLELVESAMDLVRIAVEFVESTMGPNTNDHYKKHHATKLIMIAVNTAVAPDIARGINLLEKSGMLEDAIDTITRVAKDSTRTCKYRVVRSQTDLSSSRDREEPKAPPPGCCFAMCSTQK